MWFQKPRMATRFHFYLGIFNLTTKKSASHKFDLGLLNKTFHFSISYSEQLQLPLHKNIPHVTRSQWGLKFRKIRISTISTLFHDHSFFFHQHFGDLHYVGVFLSHP